MKKSAVFYFLLIIFASLSLTGCAGNFEKYDTHISEIRDSYYTGQSAIGKLTAVSGQREEPYETDGISHKRVNFFIVTFEPTQYDVTAEYSFTIQVDGTDFTGKMKPHPFNRSYSFEVGRKSSEKSITLTLKGKDAVEEVILTEVKTENMIGADKAFNIAVNRFKDKISDFKKRDGKYEIYIRLVCDSVSGENKFCWYVSFTDGENLYALLIHPVTMEIEAVRE